MVEFFLNILQAFQFSKKIFRPEISPVTLLKSDFSRDAIPAILEICEKLKARRKHLRWR